MQLKNILSDDDAVSPVIGVILMVAITVILAAVIASFVLGLGDQAQQTTPQASFSFDYDSSVTYASGDAGGALNAGDDNRLDITHDGGDTIDDARLSVSDGSSTGSPWSSEVSAGSTVSIAIDHDDTVRIIFSGESGDTSSTLATYEAPDA